ncbi:MAG: NAD kinase [Flavobacteriales bacterium]|nr:NAD kinase [Flavobacteriales bacterium]|tara:strand:+ start:489 stop:1373 length:885 start_codon:yes stop_codon:yes gene_type:complete
MKLAVFGKRIEATQIAEFNQLFRKLKKINCEVLIYSELAEEAKQHKDLEPLEWATFSTHKDLDKEIDFLISLGGDGTFLNTILLIRDLDIPVLGINTGRLGFLSNTPTSEIDWAIDCLVSGRYSTEKRNMLSLESESKLFGDDNLALNEISLLKRDSASMIIIHVELNGLHLNSYWTDGLIISTATGSTAYSLSCGGPILMPGSGNFVITPIAPHNLNVRPIVIADDSVLKLKVESRSDTSLVALDSRSKELANDEVLIVQKAQHSLSIVQLEEHSFIQSLRHKLNWGLDKRNS